MSAAAEPTAGQFCELPGPFALESGEQLPALTVAYRTWGRPTARGDNAVLVCHGFTGSPDVERWWSPLLGPERALDPARDFVVCSNVLGGCHGTTGPASLRPDGQGRWGGAFPAITIRDMVRVQAALLDTLGVRRLRLVIGGSLGGMQALEWALLFPERVGAIVPIAVSARHSAWAIGLSAAQRRAIAADPRWRDGRYPADDPPRTGLEVARQIAMLSYRSHEGLEARFARAPGAHREFAVEGWLAHHGASLADHFDAASYVALTRAMDTHDVGRGRGGWRAALAGVHVPALVVSVDSDVLYPPSEQEELVTALPAGSLARLRSPHGHDAFLIDAEAVNTLVGGFAASRMPRRPRAEASCVA